MQSWQDAAKLCAITDNYVRQRVRRACSHSVSRCQRPSVARYELAQCRKRQLRNSSSPLILFDEVQVIPPHCDGPHHLRGLHRACVRLPRQEASDAATRTARHLPSGAAQRYDDRKL